jgi:2-methylcitrate dehydratase PrpD
MTLALETLAAFVQASSSNAHARRGELLRMHIADTLGMLRAGLDLEEGRAAARLGIPLVAWCAAARCTEADDIHLTSCTTPGSVAVPVALHLASAGAFAHWEDFCEAVLTGYEVLIRLGHAIDGPRVLAKKIWPTLYAAPLAAAAVASKAWKLSVPQTAGALAAALACSSGVAAPAVGAMSSRWMALGVAAHSGVLAAEAARQGLSGDRGLMERYGGRIAGVRISAKRLLDGLGARFLFDEIGMKPYPVAQQALAAVEICRSLAPGLDVENISEILVKFPLAQLRIVDRPGIPEHRMARIAGVQYQIAAALQAPALATKVRVQHGPHLDRHYPGAWPAQVTIRMGRRRLTRTLLHPTGDWRNPLSWAGLAAKLSANAAAGALIDRIRSAEPEGAFHAGIPAEF